MALKYFGTDGFRGEANVTLTVDHAYKIGRAVGWHYSKQATEPCVVCVGRDTRRSSQMFESALVAGLLASGASVELLGVVPTPCVSYCVRAHELSCGVMITASHNPFFDNGIKLVDHLGFKMSEELLGYVESYIDNKFEIGFATGDHVGVVRDFETGRLSYKNHLLVQTQGLNLSGKTIGLDCAHGCASFLAQEVFEATGAQVISLHTEPDGVNINRECGSTHLKPFQAFVKEHALDAAFAFDGDCDRCLAVDAQGNEVNGDKILYMCAKHMAGEGTLKDNTVVATVMSNMGFNKALEEAGIDVIHTAVGDKYVFQCMCENGYTLGGEQSGHVIFSDCEVTGDGIVTALKVLQALQASNKSLTEFAREMPEYPQILVNVKVTSKDKALSSSAVQTAVQEAEIMLKEKGRLLVRPSGTEPLVRVLVEASDEELCQKAVEHVAQALRAVE